MPAAPLPSNEVERQQTLESFHVLDVQAEPVFDTIIRLAAEICDAPIALISLVDRDRQWFFARQGIDVEQTPRVHGLCSHAILNDDLVETPDARKDERFFDSPLVTEYPGIRFYAAQPITTSNGFNLGTVCVAAREPKSLNPFQRSALQQLGQIVVMLLESRKAVLEEEKRLRHLATHDGLTALPNRVLGTDRLQTAIARARRSSTVLALLFIDLDDFKQVNDAHGHAAGDAVLAEIGRRLVTATRESDTVTRWGGDEFIVILSDIHNVGDAESKRDQLLELLNSSYRVGSQEVSVSASIGIAVFPNDGDDEQSLLQHADMAMYRHKRAADEE